MASLSDRIGSVLDMGRLAFAQNAAAAVMPQNAAAVVPSQQLQFKSPPDFGGSPFIPEPYRYPFLSGSGTKPRVSSRDFDIVRYEIESAYNNRRNVLGSGSYGIVCRPLVMDHKKDVYYDPVCDREIRSEQYRPVIKYGSPASILREAIMINAVHPNIVAIEKMFCSVDRGIMCVVMPELISLGEYNTNKRSDFWMHDNMKTLHGILKGMDYLHGTIGVAHLDFGISNLMFCREPSHDKCCEYLSESDPKYPDYVGTCSHYRPVIIDYGMCSYKSTSDVELHMVTPIGSMPFRSPEIHVLRDNEHMYKQVDAKSDVYSVGVVFASMMGLDNMEAYVDDKYKSSYMPLTSQLGFSQTFRDKLFSETCDMPWFSDSTRATLESTFGKEVTTTIVGMVKRQPAMRPTTQEVCLAIQGVQTRAPVLKHQTPTVPYRPSLKELYSSANAAMDPVVITRAITEAKLFVETILKESKMPFTRLMVAEVTLRMILLVMSNTKDKDTRRLLWRYSEDSNMFMSFHEDIKFMLFMYIDNVKIPCSTAALVAEKLWPIRFEFIDICNATNQHATTTSNNNNPKRIKAELPTARELVDNLFGFAV